MTVRDIVTSKKILRVNIDDKDIFFHLRFSYWIHQNTCFPRNQTFSGHNYFYAGPTVKSSKPGDEVKQLSKSPFIPTESFKIFGDVVVIDVQYLFLVS